MVQVETDADRTDGVTTVRVTITNTRSTVQIVRLQSALDGPVWPPRRAGVVDPRWDDDVWESAIRPDRRRGVGFASPAPPTDPPVEILSSQRHESDDPARSGSEILSQLDDWRPTTDVLERDR